MKSVGSLAMVVGTLIICGFFVYHHYPTASKVAVAPRIRLVESTHPRKVVQSITVDGKKVDVKIVANDTVYRPVQETAAREIVTQPSAMDTVRYWALVGALVVLGVYAVAVIGLWVRDKVSRRPESKDTEDTKKRFDELVRLCMAVLLTLFGSADLSRHPIEPPQANSLRDSVIIPLPEPAAVLPSHLDPLPAEISERTKNSADS